jgi:hypothetical protein
MDNQLVRIDKNLTKERIRHLYKTVAPSSRYPRGRVSLDDLLEFKLWLGQEDFAPAGENWRDKFSGGAYVVGNGVEVSTLLAADQTAVGVNLSEIRAKLKSGEFKKPRKASMSGSS